MSRQTFPYAPHPVRRPSPDRPDSAFNRHFEDFTALARKQLWDAYCRWRQAAAREDYARFYQYCLDKGEPLRDALRTMASPFINARKGEPYEIAFRLPDEAAGFAIKGLENVGLQQFRSADDAQLCTLSGIPPLAGEFDIAIFCRWKAWVPGLPHCRRVFRLLVNPDPRDLWEDRPSDQTGEYARPDTDFAILSLPPVQMWGASRRGRSHAHAASPRDDAFALDSHDGWYLLAVADGAGSAPFSRKGAEIACETGIAASKAKLTLASDLENILETLSPDSDPASWLGQAKKLAYAILPNAAFEAHKAIRQEAEARERESRAYATTLLLAMAKKYPGGWAVLSFQVGDGAMALFADGHVELLATPDEGEYGGQTRFITMNEIFEPHELLRRLRVDFVKNFEGLLLMTDGISDARFVTLDALRDEGLWRELWQELLPLARSGNPDRELLEWLNFWSRGNHDDRTLAMLALDH